MPESTVLLQTSNHIAKITLNRPDAKNEINLRMGQEMDEICRQINQDNDIYVVILTGSGSVFCNGNELQTPGKIPPRGEAETVRAEVAAWEADGNQHAKPVNWQFTTKDARIKLKRLYPTL